MEGCLQSLRNSSQYQSIAPKASHLYPTYKFSKEKGTTDPEPALRETSAMKRESDYKPAILIHLFKRKDFGR